MEKYSPLSSGLDSTESLVKEVENSDLEDGEWRNSTIQSRRGLTISRTILVHAILLIINLFICLEFAFWAKSSHFHRSGDFVAPFQHVVQYRNHTFDLSSIYLPDGSINPQRSQFGGPPRDDLLDSWGNLTQYMNIRLPPEELPQFEEDKGIVKLADGSGVFGTLAVYHGIHCINRLHRYIYKDYYYSDLTESHELKLLVHHTEHCIDWLRQYIQCNADLTVIPMYWGTKQALPMSTDIGQHQCVDWNSLQAWMKERTFDAFQPGLLIHPTFGDPYAKHESNEIGLVEGESLLKDVKDANNDSRR